jgi:hypothetical protein
VMSCISMTRQRVPSMMMIMPLRICVASIIEILRRMGRRSVRQAAYFTTDGQLAHAGGFE